MRTIFKIAKTELRDLFYSPIAWLILIIFTFQTGMLFSGMISDIVRSQSMGGRGANLTLSIFGGQRGLFVAVQSVVDDGIDESGIGKWFDKIALFFSDYECPNYFG